MVTMQHEILADLIRKKLGGEEYSIWNNDEDMMQEIASSIPKIFEGESIVVDLANKRKPIQKVAGFQDLSIIGKDSFVIPYIELDGAFHEQNYSG